MRDPFRPNSNKQLIREAQIGFAVIGMLASLLIYVAWFRISGVDQEFALDSAETSSTQQVASVPEIAPPANRTDNQLQSNSTEVAKAERTLKQLGGTAESIEQVARTVESLTNDQADSVRSAVTARSEIESRSKSASSPPHNFEGSLKRAASRIASLPPLKRKSKTDSQSKTVSKSKTDFKPNVSPLAGKSPFDRTVAIEAKPFVPQSGTSFTAKPTAFNAPDSARPTVAFRVPDSINMGTAELKTAEPKISVPESATPETFQPETFQPATPNPILKHDPNSDPAPFRALQTPAKQTPAKQEPSADPNTQPKRSRTSIELEIEPEIKTVSFEQPIEYEIKKGDSFWWIAQEHYDNGQLFRALYSHNKSRVPGFEDLIPGTKIEIPSRAELIRLWPIDIPRDVLHENDAWRKTPDDLLDKLTEECERELESRFYETRQGDTLFNIAGQRLNQASRYVELLELNRFRLPAGSDHQTPLPKGLRLVLPK